MDLTQTGALLYAAVPLAYGVAALLALRVPSAAAAWLWAHRAAWSGVALALLAMIGLAVGWGGALSIAALPLGDAAPISLSIRTDAVGAAMLLLVTFIGWVIIRYSRSYLAGDRAERRYVPALLATLAAVTLVVVTNNLAVIALAWLATSLALHRLLTLYSDRPQALIAAHKKFLASRLADLLMLAGVTLTAHALGTLEIDAALQRVQALPELPAILQAAAVLFALAAILKCAQLPIHGWLIQVMEAPTPVSALLHAGVVNLGGFVLIRLAPLIAAEPAAQGVLVVAGTVTAVLAALVMTTRISVKVMLAWSTCAQMGFMLMQIGLGAYELAMLHLVAHSLYKAHAFLGAGGAVAQARVQQMMPPRPAATVGAGLAAVAASLAAVAIAAWIWDATIGEAPSLWVLAFVAALALNPLFAPYPGRAVAAGSLPTTLAALAVPFVYFGWHALFAGFVEPTAAGDASTGLALFVALWFGLLFAVQLAIAARPGGLVAERLHPWFYAGFYLDELFTRLTFRIWPARLPAAQGARAPISHEVATGEAS